MKHLGPLLLDHLIEEGFDPVDQPGGDLLLAHRIFLRHGHALHHLVSGFQPCSAARTSVARNDSGSLGVITGPAIQIASARPLSGSKSSGLAKGPRTRTVVFRGTRGSRRSASSSDRLRELKAGMIRSLVPHAREDDSSDSDATSTGAAMCMLARISINDPSSAGGIAAAINTAASAP